MIGVSKMEIEINIKSRNSRAHAQAIYDGKQVKVKIGGIISESFAEHIKGGKSAKNYRESREYVTAEGNIIKECVFSSPSTAAQFVTGRSTNGYSAWKVEKTGQTLGEYLKEQGIRC